MNIQDAVKGFWSGCLQLLKPGGGKASLLFVRASEPAWLSGSACMAAGVLNGAMHRPAAAHHRAVCSPDPNRVLPAVPASFPSCR